MAQRSVAPELRSRRVGINLLACVPGTMGGHENFIVGSTRALVARAAGSYILFVPAPLEAWWRERVGSHVEWVTCPLAAGDRVSRVLFEHTRVPTLAESLGCEALFFPHFTAPTWKRPRTVVSIMDLLLLWDLGGYSGLRQWYHRLGYRRLARHSAHVVTISDFCRRDIHAKLGIPLDRITVAKCALDEEFRHLLPESVPEVAPPYLLSVAAAHPHKALPTLVEAFEIIAPDYPALRLALAGTHPAPRRDVARLRARVAASPVAARIQLLPPLDRARIVALFANAATYVSASRFEGFGIPVMEAMSLGCPVAAAPAEAVREVLGDHGTVAADFSARALSEAMRQALTTVAADSGRRDAGAQYVRRTFTWEATAAAIEAALFGGDAAG